MEPAPSPLFLRGLTWLMRSEGTEFVDHPHDHGGPTRYGITQASWSAFVGHVATRDEVRAITPDDATRFYHQTYWLPLQLDALSDANLEPVALAIFDQAVHSGAVTAMRLVQRAAGARVDGRMGPVTLSAIAQCGEKRFLLEFTSRILARYARIVAADTTQAVFLEGWVGRANRLLTLVA